jgi:hypothetical protein
MTTSCKCILDSYNKKCFYRNPQTIHSLEYQYWNQTFWLEQVTTNGWGSFLGGSSNNGNSTGDNLSGYGVSATTTATTSKKLKRFYCYDTYCTDNPSKLIFYKGFFVPISDIPDVKKFCKWVSV